jgi:hypothetical protein
MMLVRSGMRMRVFSDPLCDDNDLTSVPALRYIPGQLYKDLTTYAPTKSSQNVQNLFQGDSR